MGYAKSSTLNMLNLNYLLDPHTRAELPFLRLIDFGPSSEGVINILKSGLPKDRQHEVVYAPIHNTESCAMNPLDTPPGLRHPLSVQVDYLVIFLETVCRSLWGNNSLTGMIARAIDDVYNLFADGKSNCNPKIYFPGVDVELDQLIETHDLSTDQHTTYWELVDQFYDREDYSAMSRAQLYAVPVLSDLSSVINAPSFRQEYSDDVQGVPLYKLFDRAVKDALQKFKVLRGPSQINIGTARVVSLDLDAVVAKGVGDSDAKSVAKWSTAVFYLLAYRKLTEFFFVDENLLKELHGRKGADARYHDYNLALFRLYKEIPKSYCSDEIHRLKGIPTGEAAKEQMTREGRKYIVHVLLASQLCDDYSAAIVELATNIIILGRDLIVMLRS